MGQKIRSLEDGDDTRISAKQAQSELGVVGDYSPNFDLLNELVQKMGEFKHVHGELTEIDSFVFISNVGMGQRIDDPSLLGCASAFRSKGCQTHLINMITEVLVADEYLFDVFTQAVFQASIMGGPRDEDI